MRNYYTKPVKNAVRSLHMEEAFRKMTLIQAANILAEYAELPFYMKEETLSVKLAALKVWLEAGKKATDGRLTINAHDIPQVSITSWKIAKTIVNEFGIYPDVFSSCQPYQLVIT